MTKKLSVPFAIEEEAAPSLSTTLMRQYRVSASRHRLTQQKSLLQRTWYARRIYPINIWYQLFGSDGFLFHLLVRSGRKPVDLMTDLASFHFMALLQVILPMPLLPSTLDLISKQRYTSGQQFTIQPQTAFVWFLGLPLDGPASGHSSCER